MATYDYLRKQALNDIWQIPGFDRQFIISPTRITKIYGNTKNIDVMWETLKLPDDISNWHVYDAGPVSPVTLNIFRRCQGWTPLSDTTNQRGVYINAYTESGVELPRFDSFYRYTSSGSLVFAFKINNKKLVDLNTQNVYIRVYSSAAININQMPPIDLKIKTFGTYIVDSTTFDDFQTQVQALPTDGVVNLYCNGIWYADISKIQTNAGDWVEYIYDSSVYKTLEFAIKDLYHYNSTMDSDQKYLLHYSGQSNQVDFYDDIDFYVYQKDGTDPFRGVYLHKNSVTNVRQLTHRDYGVNTANIPPIARVLTSLLSSGSIAVDSLTIRLYVRRSNIDPDVLVYENTRLFELYKLSDTDIVRAMQGIDANVPFWQAPALEASWYTFAMRCSYNELTKEVAESVYGYNAAAKIIGDTPVKLTDPNPQDVNLPIRAQHGCTIYEYNEDGVLIGWYQHLGGQSYRVSNDATVYIECIIGLGADRLDQLENVKTAALDEVYTYRVYNGSIIGNVVQSTFEDVTGSDKYTIIDNNFTWTSTRLADYPIVLSDGKFYARDYSVRQQFGNITLTLISQQARPNGDGYYSMPFPMGQLDIFLNGYSLIRGIDYFVNFPEIYIVNKEFLKDPQTQDQQIHVRFCGFAKSDLSMDDEGDVGFIEHGFLSNNNKYDLRDDKVQRVIVGGKFYSKDELEFSEDHTGVSVTNAANGLPYMVKDMLVPVKPYTVSDMYQLRSNSEDIDKVVSDYLTLKLPEPDRGTLMAIVDRYEVFSPFLNNLITDIRLNTLVIPDKSTPYERQEVIDICKSYEYLLQYDPLRSPNTQDTRFIAIHPHGYSYAVSISVTGYKFMTKVVEFYCPGMVELSPFLKTS